MTILWHNLTLLAQEDGVNPLGENLLIWLLLALGGAMVAGNVAALVRPRDEAGDGDLDRAPLWRSVLMIVIGSVAAIWALVSLIAA